MTYLLQAVGAIPLSTVIVFIAALAFLVVLFVKCYKYLTDFHDKHQEKEETLKTISDNLQVITEKQDNLEKSMGEIKQEQEVLAKKQTEIENASKKREMNKLRNNLLKDYRLYTNPNKNPLLAWSEMEKDSFDRMFEDYENLGGNGHMHTTVRPAMDNLDIIPMTDVQKLIELMQSRKG